MYEHRNAMDAERLKQLEFQLKEARNGVEEADHKYDEVVIYLFVLSINQSFVLTINQFCYIFKRAKKLLRLRMILKELKKEF